MVRAWYIDDSAEDQRLPHMTDPPQFVSLEKLKSGLGVLHWKDTFPQSINFNAHQDYKDTVLMTPSCCIIALINFTISRFKKILRLSGDIKDPELLKIRTDRGYSYEDTIEIARDTLPDYDNKLKIFFQEHLHADEEIRYILEGSGYFDVRTPDDKWIRIECGKGDLLVLPAGIYHRFTLDKKDYIKANRLFTGTPVWTAVNRPADDHPSRVQYLQTVRACS